MAAGTPGTTLERHALLVEEQRFLRAAVEDERVAPLEPGDQQPLAGLVGDEHGDRVLFALALGRRAGRNALGVGPRPAQHALHRLVVDDDVGFGQQLHAARAHEAGVARARADDDDPSAPAHGRPLGAKYPARVRAAVSARATRTSTRRHAPSRFRFEDRYPIAYWPASSLAIWL